MTGMGWGRNSEKNYFLSEAHLLCCLGLQPLWELLIDYFELNQVKRARKRLHGMPPSV